jgi:pyridoxine kinase
MNVLSIQSSVAYGHVGNSAATFVLQRLGVTAWPVHTVLFSNHTGYADWRGRVIPADEVADVIAGIEDRGVFPECDAVLSGYVGDAALAEVIADTVRRIKAANPRALYCCDPVLGNAARGLFAAEPVARAMRDQLLPLADIATPNAFELAWLTGRPVTDAATARAAADALGPSRVVCTSLPMESGLGVLARDDHGAWLVETPRLDVAANGAGDTFAAILLARLLHGDALETATEHATSAVLAVLEATRAAGARELHLIEAQSEIATPTRRFRARRLTP